ncbi:MAG: DEAD/DEAH box helicase [Actinomycetota bacterium]|nr:DEAD/DEAH box helicase [Actinomycetota bacterium]
MDPVDIVARHADRVTHLEHIEARDAVYADWPAWVDADVRDMYAAAGVTHLWSHQAEAAELAHGGQHVVIATGTASGKSFAYQAPALTALAAGRTGSPLRGHRSPTVLYLSPTKALAADQLLGLAGASGLMRGATVDGDNSREERVWARDHANYILTNPDTLHHTMLPAHARWSRFLGGLHYVVIDECHHYRGVFGAHLAQIIRRLRRIALHYGAEPTFILASATIAHPEVSAGRITGLDVRAVTEDASPHGPSTIALWEPPLLPGTDTSTQTAIRRPATTEAGEILTDLVVGGVRTLAFVRSRRGAETVSLGAQRRLGEIDPDLVSRVATYRGGYLPEDRRELERQLRSGELLGLASTNALELGIDIAGLDAIISVGYPGTRAALQQQFGRAGRTGQASLGVMVARDDPLDTYLVHHPEALLDAPVEATVFDPDNPYVLGPHLAAAAQELPLTETDFELFGPRTEDGVNALTDAGLLRKRTGGWFWTKRERASNLADIRSSGGSPVQIVDAATGRLIGTVDASSADSTVHEGAVYVHQGDSFLVDEYDLEHGIAAVHRDNPDYSTMARSLTEISITEVERQQVWGDAAMTFGSVEVAHQVVSFLKRRSGSGEVLGEELLDLPSRSLQTKAVWWTLSPPAVAKVLDTADVPGAAHAAEHAAIGMLPLLATCDRWDIGGVSTAMHPDTGTLTVFVYDGYPGGAGFAERGYEVAARWLQVTRDAIDACECSGGCPSCVHSPKCGNGNEPLDKAAAIVLLDALLSQKP